MFRRGQTQIVDVNKLLQQTMDYGEAQAIRARVSALITESVMERIQSDEKEMLSGSKMYEWSSCIHPFDGSISVQRLADAIGYEMPDKTRELLHDCMTKVTAYLDEQKKKEAEEKEKTNDVSEQESVC